MCRAVDERYSQHLVKGIASVPVGAIEQAQRKGSIVSLLIHVRIV